MPDDWHTPPSAPPSASLKRPVSLQPASPRAAGEGQAGGTLTKRPGTSGGGGAAKGPASGSVMARKAAARRPTARSGGGGNGAGILRFYTDDAPGLKM
ncbi:hypothetical protein EMIHUDRAFT_254815 [Emiliania huxleyi CCMP1516]|uniref:Protein transport protein Sec61 subunit beta n=2 Tax=Emiliania huxleyi TaxID=2903 RepID=A0A0D3JL41_EMIH1|nr:hypothetical protein EMIHUDRAFT_254815 [Emiliania huxleyi CCMP1516]EOD24226.1 hypothetical protein EMIHUDRAFT_254815 [Emiliania huxleyi CCMP1516]|eukprot:XP_005776655.1 hypothetical protein EMIHUDRAFT_254815 [Emiliania huxleyi CCMP1516]